MKDSYLEKYYPDGISAEERLFTTGEKLTRTSPSTWWKTIGVGIALAVLGLMISNIDYETISFGMFMFTIGDLVVGIAVIGLSMYVYGLRCLERAELLYNTRLAGREEESVSVAAPIEASPARPASRAVLNWTCTCGKVNSDYMTVCACGVTKQQAKDARQRVPSGWRCTCGKEHPAYVSSCSCGVNKNDVK